ncbi:glycerol-3-phosphate 1-O-acyltransferase PlsY [Sodalis sp. CWE]|uniref:glycerol-3-phosphate 1-O-acyltransferase PlsY n=1 Tax=Sodalis sp. CWE TaxID=2803816 RepID=UPI001C7D7B2A|nr:glycerol-3-phosphate 1-O-acyltransferase PlsY [Sodalis sp. CWE]
MNVIPIGMIVFSYLYGSISSAILICRFMQLPDPRSVGSKNAGATNVIRTGGKLVVVIGVVIFDVLKGFIPTWISYYILGLQTFWLSLIGLASCLGHIYPVFFHFHGGKGVATALGTIIPIGYDLFGLIIGTWFSVAFLSGYSSLGTIISIIIAFFYVFWTKPQFIFQVGAIAFLVLLCHHENIYRLLKGQENHFWPFKGKLKSFKQKK